MKKKYLRRSILLVLLLLLATDALAMSSTNYRLDWLTPLTGGGGGTASSAQYAVNLTVGQAVVGNSASVNYQVGLGYWYGDFWGGRLFLPLIKQ
jgi:hypothetical protein